MATVGFPIYDAHGNNVATLSRNGSGYSVNDRRSYDAWEVVRAQQSGGDPKLRYCANLGHKQDDESGLIYMRARYYEPSSGRFVSEDRMAQSINDFVYCHNNPIDNVDADGNEDQSIASVWYHSIKMWGQVVGSALLGVGVMFMSLAMVTLSAENPSHITAGKYLAKAGVIAYSLGSVGIGQLSVLGWAIIGPTLAWMNRTVDLVFDAAAIGSETVAGPGIRRLAAQQIFLIGEITALGLMDATL